MQEGPLDLPSAIRIALEVASALHEAHEKNIVHRDIKSQNIMLGPDGRAKVLDFGLAKTAQSTKLTRMGSTVGTVSYMSPQQARVEEVDHRTDLWSLGVVLYEMIAGRLPFGAEYEQAVIYGILNQDPEPLTSIRTGVPMELERVVMKCLEKDVDLRYQHADGLMADLRGITFNKETTRSLPVTQETTTRKRVSPGHVFALLLGVALAGTAFWANPFKTENRHFHPVSLERLTIGPQEELWPTIHPNGDRIVYGAAVDGRWQLFQRSITGGEPAPLVSGFEGPQMTPQFSPDGTEVVFASDGTIYVVPGLGGVPRVLMRSRPGESQLQFPTWSKDGRRLALTSEDDSVFVYNLDTGDFRSPRIH